MATGAQIARIANQARALGLDPNAVLAIASHEGLGGGIGDNGTSFGPFQLHEGGALPTSVPLSQAQAWAWSPAGINYALGKMAGVAKGLTGRQAVTAISTQFERPADPAAEIADAMAHYGKIGAGSSNGRTAASEAVDAGSTPAPAATLGGNQMALLSLLNSGGVNFNSNQVQAPNLMALAQLRQSVSGGAFPTAPRTTASGRALPPRGPVKAGVPVEGLTSIGGQHPTEGLAGYPAHDYFAPAGSEVVAPVSGKVIRLSGHDPKLGPIEGPHGPLGWSVYIQGTDGHTYYLTHMGSRSVRVGETLKAGTPIGTVANYAQYGTPSHIHMGVH